MVKHTIIDTSSKRRESKNQADLDAEADLQEALADMTHQSSTNASSVPKLAPKVISKPLTAVARAKEMNIYMKFDVLKHHLMKKKK